MLRWHVYLLAIGLACLPAWPSYAVDLPVRDPGALNEPQAEEVLRVRDARVVVADYDLIRKDFPSTLFMTEGEIDLWLLQHTAYLSRGQAAQAITNSPVAVTGEVATAFRPLDYGRSLVFKMDAEGLIDAKGAGAVRPAPGGHANGLATLGEAIREYLYEKLAKRLLQHSQVGVDTVGTYGVIDYGFDVIHQDGKRDPAGLILRQAHQRYKGPGSLLDDARIVPLENVFRTYGVTSAGAYRSEPLERLNIQAARDGSIVDFGAFLAEENFHKSAIHFYGEKILISPDSADFVQPDAAVRVPLDHWGYGASGVADPKKDNPWKWSHELAKNFREGNASRADVDQHMRNFLGPVEEKLAVVGGQPNPRFTICAEAFAALKKALPLE